MVVSFPTRMVVTAPLCLLFSSKTRMSSRMVSQRVRKSATESTKESQSSQRGAKRWYSPTPSSTISSLGAKALGRRSRTAGSTRTQKTRYSLRTRSPLRSSLARWALVRYQVSKAISFWRPRRSRRRSEVSSRSSRTAASTCFSWRLTPPETNPPLARASVAHHEHAATGVRNHHDLASHHNPFVVVCDVVGPTNGPFVGRNVHAHNYVYTH